MAENTRNMFGSSLFDAFNNDPFFSAHQQQMQQMQQMQSMMGGMFGAYPNARPQAARPQAARPQAARPQAALTHTHQAAAGQRHHQLQVARQDPYAGMGLFGSPMFSPMDSMMMNMQSMMGGMHGQMTQQGSPDPNQHFYSQSTMMSYRNDGGEPQVYQASSSTRQAPGGVRETRQSVRDSSQGLEKMKIGHHIGERGHVRERKKDTRTGDLEENTDFINIQEEEAESFGQEFRTRMQPNYPPSQQSNALTEGRTRASHSYCRPSSRGSAVRRQDVPKLASEDGAVHHRQKAKCRDERKY